MNRFQAMRPWLSELAQRGSTRRTFVASVLLGLPMLRQRLAASAAAGPVFDEVPASNSDILTLPAGYHAHPIARWGDPILAEALAFDPLNQSAVSQAGQFGFNCDFNAFFPMASGASDAGLLCTNHEYTSRGEMIAGEQSAAPDVDAARHAVEIAAHGVSIVALVRRDGGPFEVARESPANRRITGATPMSCDGPAAGSRYLVTSADSTGTSILGTLGNCAGGRTPWGTLLTCEENFNEYFSNRAAVAAGEVHDGLARYGCTAGAGVHAFAKHEMRFDLAREPNEAHRFGWIVEIDPLDATALPIKHTALGRLKHESATLGQARDGRVVVYTGDDEAGEYLYKFVSHKAPHPTDRAANARLLSEGTLYVARFFEDGTGEWLALVPQGPLAKWSPARIAVHTREAADLLDATPMDRPEDVEIGALDGRVYVCLTANPKREQGDGGPNPRAKNTAGQILELDEVDSDHAALRFVWSLLLVCGDNVQPALAEAGGRGPAALGIARPDNLACDARGNLWVTTDGQPSALGTNDAMWVVPTAGARRAVPQRFLTGPIGCELTGPEFTPDGRTLFLSIQHPGEGGGLSAPTSRWPHDETGLPRPSVVAIERTDGRPIVQP